MTKHNAMKYITNFLKKIIVLKHEYLQCACMETLFKCGLVKKKCIQT